MAGSTCLWMSLALLMSKPGDSTGEGGTWTSLDQKSTPQTPLGKPDGGLVEVLPHRREPCLPSHSKAQK